MKIWSDVKKTYALIIMTMAIVMTIIPACGGGNQGDSSSTNGDAANQDISGDGSLGDGNQSTIKSYGEACTEDKECEGGKCVDFKESGHGKICTGPCSESEKCPEYFECNTEKGYCEPTFGTKTYGQYCKTTSDCTIGLTCFTKGPSDVYAFCSKECTSEKDCPDDLACGAWEDKLVCKKRGYCDSCSEDNDCPDSGSKCIIDDKGKKFCSKSCVLDKVSCPSGSFCKDIGGGILQCYPSFGSCVGDGKLCHPCRIDDDCEGDGYCYVNHYTGERFCSLPCTETECEAQNYDEYVFLCVELDGQMTCLPSNEDIPMTTCSQDIGQFCSPCSQDNQCDSNICGIALGGEGMILWHLCTTSCETDCDCPSGTSCVSNYSTYDPENPNQPMPKACRPLHDRCDIYMKCQELDCNPLLEHCGCFPLNDPSCANVKCLDGPQCGK